MRPCVWRKSLSLSFVLSLSLLMTLSIVDTSPAQAEETMAVTLDGVSVDTCDTDWMERSCTLRVVDTAIGDYTAPGFCIFFPQAEGLALMGARLEIDVGAVTGVDLVEVDLREVSGSGRSRVFLFEEGATNYFQFVMSNYTGSATEQTLPIFIVGSVVDKVVISAHEALIQEVRLVGNVLVDLENPSWGMLKAQW